jgi:predicted negative regulator of RcsB-dependent stress response
LLLAAEIQLAMGASKADMQRNLDLAALLFRTVKFDRGVTMCNTIIADILLQEGNALAAKTLIEESLQSSLEHHTIVSYCLAQLSDMTHWDALPGMSHWPTVFLAHSLKSKQKLGIYKALQSIGDVMLAQNDKHTAITLFRLALEGFTEMDVHRSRAECMLRLGDICQQHNNLFEAIEHWNTARPLFERSSQVNQIVNIDKKLASVSADVLEQHRNNLVHLAIPNIPAVLPE